MGHARGQLAHVGQPHGLPQQGLLAPERGEVLEQHHGALVGARGARDGCHRHQGRSGQGLVAHLGEGRLRAFEPRVDRIRPLARRAEQPVRELAGQLLDGPAEQVGQSAVGLTHAPGVVEHHERVGDGVEGRLPGALALGQGPQQAQVRVVELAGAGDEQGQGRARRARVQQLEQGARARAVDADHERHAALGQGRGLLERLEVAHGDLVPVRQQLGRPAQTQQRGRQGLGHVKPPLPWTGAAHPVF